MRDTSRQSPHSILEAIDHCDGGFFSNDVLPIDGEVIDLSSYGADGHGVLTAVVPIKIPRCGYQYLYKRSHEDLTVPAGAQAAVAV